MRVKKSLMLWVAVFALALPLLLTGTASAKYMGDGAVPDGAGGWKTPNDGICVVGLHADGTVDVADGITSKRDCIYLNVGTMNGGTAFDLKNMNGDTGGACTKAGATGNTADGTTGTAKHAVTTSGCFDSSGNGVSLKDRDRTQAMCLGLNASNTWIASGGTKCVPYGWQYRSQDAAGAALTFSSNAAGDPGNHKGTESTQNAGFCYTSMRTGITTASSCPSANTNATTAFGYSFSSGKCNYAYGVTGVVAGALTNAAGGTYAAADTFVDLTTLTTWGDCKAAGASWDNWIPKGAGATTVQVVTGGTATTVGVLFDLTQQAVNADDGCLHCHSSVDQANGPAERQKDSALKTGHKNMLRKVVGPSPWSGPDALGALATYTTDTTTPGADTINFDNAGIATINIGGTDRQLYYIYGDWMAALPSVAYATGSTYGCGACHTEGFKDNTNPGVQSIGTPSYTPAQPVAPYSTAVTGGHKWDNEGISCGRCHNATVPSVTSAHIISGCTNSTTAPNQSACEGGGGAWVASASSFPTTAPTGGGMGALAAGVGRNNLCFGCHQSIAKNWPAQGGAAGTGTTQYDPTLIPTGVNHGAAAGRDFNGHVLGNSFLNSVHAKYAGVNSNSANGGIKLNSLGKYDLFDAQPTNANVVLEYGSAFQGFSCFQGPTTNTSPAKTKADGTEIKSKSECEALYGAGAWRNDTYKSTDGQSSVQGTCATCHDVHNSLFIAGQEGIRKECVDCHQNADFAAAVPAAIQYDDTKMVHPRTAGTPWDATLYGADPCSVCHMATQAKANGNQNSMPVHLWRINTSAAYNTFPTADQFGNASGGLNGATQDRNAQTSPDGSYTKAVWVDLDLACGQCHGGSLGVTANGAPSFTKAQLEGSATDLHNGGSTTNSKCLACHSTAQGTRRAVNQGVDHHNGTCTTCHTPHKGTPAMSAPSYTITLDTKTPPNRVISNTIQSSCLTCHPKI